MSLVEQFTKVAIQQDAFNKVVYPDWMERGFAWHRASMVELVEFLEHLNSYKWWKGKSPDFKQAEMELIDVVHFVVSDLLCGHSAGIPCKPEEVGVLASKWFDPEVNERYGAALAKTESLRALDDAVFEEVHAVVDTAVGRAARKDPLLLESLVTLCGYMGLTGERVVNFYYGKNSLNIVRQRLNYKKGVWTPGKPYVKGHYIKMWGPDYSKEDNEVLFEILENYAAEIAASSNPMEFITEQLLANYPKAPSE